jgi:hypothetical protein
METIKSFTDVSQSKTLSKFLPLDSADYTRLGKDEDNVLTRSYFESCSSELKEWIDKDEIYPCWSLAALFRLLPNSAQLEKGHSTELCRITLPIEYIDSDWCINPIDACYQIVMKLKENNLI